jgi:hypothetical protein
MGKKGDSIQKLSLKGRLPFRLGTTSYILPADLLTNVEHLAGQVDDIEIVLFESHEISNLPDENTILALKALKKGRGLSYTIHLPLDIYLGAEDETVRRRSVEKCLQIFRLTRPLEPFAYILHFHLNPGSQVLRPEGSLWEEKLERSMEDLLNAGPPARNLCVETLNYPFYWIEGILFRYHLSVCLDVGHILLNQFPLKIYLDRYLDQTRVVHLHGLTGGEDHQGISQLPSGHLKTILTPLSTNQTQERVVTLEIFNQDDFQDSLAILDQFYHYGDINLCQILRKPSQL